MRQETAMRVDHLSLLADYCFSLTDYARPLAYFNPTPSDAEGEDILLNGHTTLQPNGMNLYMRSHHSKEENSTYHKAL